MKVSLFFVLAFVFNNKLYSQCKQFYIGKRGDTLNCVDAKNIKQGKWVVRVETVRGEPGYEEEGIYLNNYKEGTWKVYNLVGDKIAEENFRWGNKEGICTYFFPITGSPMRVESWVAMNPNKKRDTINVLDPRDPLASTYIKKVIDIKGYSLRHGVWKYYDEQLGFLRSETYILDSLAKPQNLALEADPDKKDQKPKEKPKPKQVEAFEKKNKKKKIKYYEGMSG
jgi:hypothetical protein